MQNIVIIFTSCFYIVKIFVTFVAIVFAIVFVATVIFVDVNP